MLDYALHFIPLAFAALLPIVNPVGSALIFLSIVGPEPPAFYRQLALRIAINMLIFIAVIELIGAWLLKFFGISLPILQVGGGLTLAAMGWRLLNAPDAATPAAAAIESDSNAAIDKLFYPLTFPLTVGPGTIVVVLTLSANASGHGWADILLAHASIFVASALVALLVFLSYGYAPVLARKIPEHAFNGVQRLISFILLCIGVQIAWGGLDTLLSTLPH
jgi:multiple antibiotic resistance protein